MGLFSMSMAMFGFAFSSLYKDSRSTFLIITYITRFLQGFSSSTIQTTVFSATGQLFAANQHKAIAWMEIASGLGLAGAPPLGKFMYAYMGYAGPFLLIGGMFLIASIVIKNFVPV